jgi:hypothetical protein
LNKGFGYLLFLVLRAAPSMLSMWHCNSIFHIQD